LQWKLIAWRASSNEKDIVQVGVVNRSIKHGILPDKPVHTTVKFEFKKSPKSESRVLRRAASKKWFRDPKYQCDIQLTFPEKANPMVLELTFEIAYDYKQIQDVFVLEQLPILQQMETELNERNRDNYLSQATAVPKEPQVSPDNIIAPPNPFKEELFTVIEQIRAENEAIITSAGDKIFSRFEELRSTENAKIALLQSKLDISEKKNQHLQRQIMVMQKELQEASATIQQLKYQAATSSEVSPSTSHLKRKDPFTSEIPSKRQRTQPMVMIAKEFDFIEKKRLGDALAKINVQSIQESNDEINSAVTHIVSSPLFNSTTLLTAAATSRWIMRPEWIYESSKMGTLLDEMQFPQSHRFTEPPLKGQKIFLTSAYKYALVKSIEAGQAIVVEQPCQADISVFWDTQERELHQIQSSNCYTVMEFMQWLLTGIKR
jgi:hypothetical protein